MPSWPTGSAPPTTQLGSEAGKALTLKLDQPMGAVQYNDRSGPRQGAESHRKLQDER